jgi:hypothetical protein
MRPRINVWFYLPSFLRVRPLVKTIHDGLDISCNWFPMTFDTCLSDDRLELQLHSGLLSGIGPWLIPIELVQLPNTVTSIAVGGSLKPRLPLPLCHCQPTITHLEARRNWQRPVPSLVSSLKKWCCSKTENSYELWDSPNFTQSRSVPYS